MAPAIGALHLRRAFGFHGDFKDIRISAQAAMFRTSHLEDHWAGGLDCSRRAEDLRLAYANTRHFVRSREWSDWYAKAAVTQMAALQTKLRQSNGMRGHSVGEGISCDVQRPWPTEATIKVRKQFQRNVTDRLREKSIFDGENRVRYNLKRFGLLDRWAAAAALKRLNSIAKQVTPRMWALWNRWLLPADARSSTRSACWGASGGRTLLSTTPIAVKHRSSPTRNSISTDALPTPGITF